MNRIIKESKTANPFLNVGFEHPLAQNDEQFMGYTVFHLNFPGGMVKMMSLVDVKHILELERNKQ
jgi:hypothetical protein